MIRAVSLSVALLPGLASATQAQARDEPVGAVTAQFDQEDATACTRLGNRLIEGDGIAQDNARGVWVLAKGCRLKSQATQATLDDYLGRFERDGSCQHFFFVCHTAPASLKVPHRAGVHLWTGPSLAKAVIDAGLFDWLVDRTL